MTDTPTPERLAYLKLACEELNKKLPGAHRELGQREGRELERAEIVAWLRAMIGDGNDPWTTAQILAALIERRDHKGGDDGR